MTAPVEQAVAARLAELAARAEPPDGVSTATRALDLVRSRRRRAAAWVAGGLAVVALATGVSVTGTTTAEAPVATRPARSPVPELPPPDLYEVPVRGSLADDEDFLAAVAALDWTYPPTAEFAVSDWSEPELDASTRRVVYAADVPGGHRWAVVIGRSGWQWYWAWFTGPRGAAAEEMTLQVGSMQFAGQDRLALMDVSAETGPLVVLAEPGVAAEYSPSLDRAPDGELVRDFDPLPVVDGVPLDVVRTPIVWSAGQVRLADGGPPVFPMPAGQHPAWPARPSGPVDYAAAAPCLEQLGFTVELEGAGLSMGEAERPEMSSVEEAAREEQVAACFRAAQR